MKQTLTAEQLEALQQFAKQYGRTWKSALREAWMTGDYGTFETSNLLQQIRNTFGPSWLVSFRLPNETPVSPVSGSHYDYVNQAWTLDGKYVVCAHPDSPHCDCYGSKHAGEFAPIENLPTAQESSENPRESSVDWVQQYIGTPNKAEAVEQVLRAAADYLYAQFIAGDSSTALAVDLLDELRAGFTATAEHTPVDPAPPETRRVDQIPGELAFTCDSTEVAEIRANFQLTDYDSFFVGIGDGDYTEVWGMHGTVPENSRTVYRVL
jgi:hypothetical protein